MARSRRGRAGLGAFQLAEHGPRALGRDGVSLGELREDGAKDRSVRRLLSEDAGFSARTVVLGTKRLIVHNPRQTPDRRASNLSHELSHLILEHEAATAIGIGGGRDWDGAQEAEADWLGAALLVPRKNALEWMLQNGDLEDGARNFGVSLELFRWRVNHTGVVRQLARGR